ncbi:MAG: hypothetical protein QMD71_04475 [bacterium]|nr:hypothetical protein [bacterium]
MIIIEKPHLKLILNNRELLSSLNIPILGSIDDSIVVTYLYSNKFPKLRGQFLLSKTSVRHFPSSPPEKLFNFVTYKDGNIYLQKWDDEMFIVYDEHRLTETVYIKRNAREKQFLCNRALSQGISFSLGCRGYIPLHSAAVSRDGRGYLLVGPSGSGKTTLCISLLRKGFSFLDDDMVLLKKERGKWELFSCYWPSHADYELLRLYPELNPFVKNYTIKLNEVFPTLGKSILHKILLPCFSKCQGLKVKSIGKKDTLCRIFGDKMNFSSTRLFYPDDRKRFDFIFDLVKETECYMIELGKGWIEKITEELF